MGEASLMELFFFFFDIHVWLTENNIGKEGGKAIGEMLKTNTILRELYLERLNKIHMIK